MTVHPPSSRALAGPGRQPGRFHKPFQIVMAKELGHIGLMERKTLNYLFLRTFREVSQAKTQVIHRVAVSDVLTFLRLDNPTRLMECLAKLGSEKISIDYVSDTGVKNSVVGHYLSYHVAHAVDGWLHFSFDPIILQFFDDPKVFSTLYASHIREFKRDYAARLYEIMASYAYRDFNNAWEPSVEEFRSTMSIKEDEYLRFDNLRQRVIEPAVDEVNEVAPFILDISYVRAGRGGKVRNLRIAAKRKDLRALADTGAAEMTKRHRNSTRDPQTVDMLDGLTDEEREGLYVSLEAVERARAMCGPESSAELLVDEWREAMRGRSVRFPDSSFLAWVQMRQVREESEDLKLLDGNTIDELLEISGY